MTIGWGIIGIGLHASRIMAPAITQAQGARLVAVCSRNSERAVAFAKEHRAERSYTSYEEMLQDPGVQAVYIATPNALHAEQTIQAARSGKHVLCEKPLALTVAKAENMVRVCREEGVKLGVALQNRYHPAHIEMRRVIASGEAGELLLLFGEYSRDLVRPLSAWKGDPALAGGGALMGMGTHVIDLFRFLTGQEVEEVRAQADAAAWDLPVDSLVMAILQFPGKLRAIMVSGYGIPQAYNSVVVYGTRARLTGLSTVGMYHQGTLLIERDGGSIKREFPTDDPIRGNYIRMVEAFVSAVQEDTEPDVPGAEGVELARIVEAVQESARTRKAVSVNREQVARGPKERR